MTPGQELLAWFNGLPADMAGEHLRACCSASAWVRQMTGGRPYPSVRCAIRRSRSIVAEMSVGQLAEALAGHPRIGENPGSHLASSRSAEWSRREQAGVRASDPETIRALAEANSDYERRFHHPYLVCASGRSGEQLLEVLRSRMRNEIQAEWGVVRSELQKINEIRLTRLLAGPG